MAQKPEAVSLHWGPRHSSLSMGPQLAKQTPFTLCATPATIMDVGWGSAILSHN